MNNATVLFSNDGKIEILFFSILRFFFTDNDEYFFYVWLNELSADQLFSFFE